MFSQSLPVVRGGGRWGGVRERGGELSGGEACLKAVRQRALIKTKSQCFFSPSRSGVPHNEAPGRWGVGGCSGWQGISSVYCQSADKTRLQRRSPQVIKFLWEPDTRLQFSLPGEAVVCICFQRVIKTKK